MTVFVDSSYFIVRLMPRDQHHLAASGAVESSLRYVTSSLVLNETISVLQARGYLSQALEFLREVRAIPELRNVYADAVLQADAWDLFHRLGGTGATAVDCESFAIMRSLSIRKAFTFDEHFQRAEFEILH